MRGSLIVALASCFALLTGTAAATGPSTTRTVKPGVENQRMLAVAPVPKGATTGAPTTARRQLENDSYQPADAVVLRHFWTVDTSADDIAAHWDSVTPKGMSSDSSAGYGGATQDAFWFVKKLPKNLLSAELWMVVTPLSAHRSAVMALASSEPSLPVAAFRIPASVHRVTLSSWSAAPSTRTKQLVVRDTDAAALIKDINDLRPYPKNPNLTCGSGRAHSLAVLRTAHQVWQVDLGDCGPAITITRGNATPREFHSSKTYAAAVKADLS